MHIPQNLVLFRGALDDAPLPYEILFGHESPSTKRAVEAAEIIESGWTRKGFGPVKIDCPFDWFTQGPQHRSWRFHLHCLDFLGPLLAMHSYTGEEKYLDYSFERMVDWARQHRKISSEGFAWYDMAIGVRAYRLAYVFDVALRRPDRYLDDELIVLAESIALHQRAFEDESNFAAHSNHGLYFAAGQVAMARRLHWFPGMDVTRALGEERLRRVLTTQFSPDGVHREHSPDYHRMVWETVQGMIEAGILDKGEHGPTSRRIQEALAWFVQPDRTLTMFGDTPRREITWNERRLALVEDEHLRHAASAGEVGLAPAEPMRVFSESGFAIVRASAPEAPADFSRQSYLAQICAFNSRTHKHADNLSLVWYDRGSEVLVDSGRFGYLDPTKGDSELGREGFYYAHPSRVYVESTRAHNTVEIDGKSHQRRGVKPFGSALGRTGESDGVFFIESEMRHHRTIRHTRLVYFRPGKWLLVHDRLADSAEQPHVFKQWFQFAPELDLTLRGANLEIDLPDSAERLFVSTLLDGSIAQPIRGQTEPELQGWISRKDGELTPSWSVPFEAKGSVVQCATLFAFGQEAPTLLDARSSPSATGATFRWEQGRHTTRLKVKRTAGSDFELTHSFR